MDETAGIIEGFEAMGDIAVGFGLEHPVAPDLRREEEVRSFLAQLPPSCRDPDWLAFLLRYGGLQWEIDAGNFGLMGYRWVSEDLIDAEEEAIDEHGFLSFAYLDVALERMELDVTLIYGFDATGERRPGVYRLQVNPEPTPDTAWAYYQPSFMAFLRAVAAVNGEFWELMVPRTE